MYYNDMNEKIVYVNNASRNGFLDVMMAGVTYPNADYSIVRGEGAYHVFEYVVSGRGWIVPDEDSEPLEVAAGDFYYLGLNKSLYYYADRREPYEKIWVNVSGSLVDGLTSLYRMEDVVVRRVNVRQNFLELHDILSQMTVEDARFRLKDIARCLFALISDVQHPVLFPEKPDNDNIAEQMRNFIDNNIYNDITLDLIADSFHVTKMHIIRIFKKEFGITPMQYVITKRIDIAKGLLDNTVMPIKEISSLLKYSNTQHFSNTFKKCTGTSPNRHRRSAKKAEIDEE